MSFPSRGESGVWKSHAPIFHNPKAERGALFFTYTLNFCIKHLSVVKDKPAFKLFAVQEKRKPQLIVFPHHVVIEIILVSPERLCFVAFF